jgi:uncharacterized membrane protein
MRTIDIIEQDENGLKAFIMTLRPRRSADPRVAYSFCAILGCIWFCAGTIISLMGGWPVVGFFGAEFLVIGSMVHIFIRRTEVLETVAITSTDITVVRKALGVVETKTFPASWAQIHYAGSGESSTALEIRSHGEGIEIGKFLSTSEKNKTAGTLNDALKRIRTKALEVA